MPRVHAAGVVVADQPLDELPAVVQGAGHRPTIVTQFDGPTVETGGPAKDGLSGSAHAEHRSSAPAQLIKMQSTGEDRSTWRRSTWHGPERL